MNKIKTAVLMVIILFVSSNLIAGQKKILNIASYHPENSWTHDCVEGIEKALGSEYEIENYYMDTKRIPASEFQKAADAAWEKYKASNPDLVMLGDDNALKLLGPRFAETQTPVVDYGVNNNPRTYFSHEKVPANIVGVLERPFIIPWVRYLKQIAPNVKKIMVMFDASPSSEAVISVAFHNQRSITVTGIVADLKVTDKWDEWKNAVIQTKGKYDAIIMVNHFTIKDSEGKTIKNEDIILQCSSLSPVPIFATNNFTVHSKGAVGALVIVGQEHGKEAGEMAKEILKGKPIRSIVHRTQTAGTFYFNKEQLARFNLKLPPDIEQKAIFQ